MPIGHCFQHAILEQKSASLGSANSVIPEQPRRRIPPDLLRTLPAQTSSSERQPNGRCLPMSPDTLLALSMIALRRLVTMVPQSMHNNAAHSRVVVVTRKNSTS